VSDGLRSGPKACRQPAVSDVCGFVPQPVEKASDGNSTATEEDDGETIAFVGVSGSNDSPPAPDTQSGTAYKTQRQNAIDHERQ
jgi:hypothetical protein